MKGTITKMVVVNTAGVAAGFNPVKEEDWYDAVLTGHKTDESAGQKGEPGTTLEFTLEDPREDGHKVWRFYSLSAKALPYIKGAAVELGVDPTILEGSWDPDELFPQYYGSKCKVFIKHGEYNGSVTDNLTQVKSREFTASAPKSKAKAGSSW